MHKVGAVEDAIEGRAPPNPAEDAMRSKKERVVHVGIDVSKDTLDTAWFGLDGTLGTFKTSNSPDGFAEIVSRITAGKIARARVVFEATGPYGDHLTTHLLQAARVEVMVVQPKAARAFARATMRRAKTDAVDAIVLAEFARRMPFTAVHRASKRIRQIRSLARHLGTLIDRRAELRNQDHAAHFGEESELLTEFIEREELMLSALINELEAKIVAMLRSSHETSLAYERFTALPGIKDRSAARLLPELLAMPSYLTPRQAVAFAGLDPRPSQSGTSRQGTSWGISKQGNARLRRALYMVVLTAMRWFRPLRDFYERLRARNKEKKVAITAAMRKLLTALWVIVARGEAFDELKFAGAPHAP